MELQPASCGCDARRAHRPGLTDWRRSEPAHLILTGPTRAHLFFNPMAPPAECHHPMDPKPKGGDGSSEKPPYGERGGPPSRAEARRRPRNHHHQADPGAAPCGACKFLRRKCVSGCVFAPHFGTEQGAARFAAVHKVFGASNVSKMLLHVPVGRRHDAVVTICYEAQARLSDPVYGCVSTILALQHQVGSLQTELSIVQSQLMSSRWAVTNAIQGLQQPQHTAVSLQPAYSNNSSASNNLVGLSSFSSGLELPNPRPPSRGLESLQLSQPSQDDEESRNPAGFNNGVFDPK